MVNSCKLFNLFLQEVWTLCRIFKRIPSYKKYVPADNKLKETTTKKSSCPLDHNDSSSKSCSLETDYTEPYISLELDTSSDHQYRRKAVVYGGDDTTPTSTTQGSWYVGQYCNNNVVPLAAHDHHLHHVQAPFSASYPSFNLNNPNSADDFFMNGSWDELRSVVQLAVDPHDPSQLYDIIR